MSETELKSNPTVRGSEVLNKYTIEESSGSFWMSSYKDDIISAHAISIAEACFGGFIGVSLQDGHPAALFGPSLKDYSDYSP